MSEELYWRWLTCNITLISLIYKTSLFISTFGNGNLAGLSNICIYG